MSSNQIKLTTSASSSSTFSSLSRDSIDLSSDPIWFARLQEILLMHRPFDFCVLLAVTELIFGFIYFLNLGIFATIALLGLISYMLFIHYCHPNPIFEKIFFPPLKKPIDQTQPNRIRSYEEFSNFIASVHHGFQHYFGHKHLTGIKRIIFGVGSFIFALLLKRVVPFWVNFLLVHCILFLPLAILRPWPNKDISSEEPRPEEPTTQEVSQKTSTEATQAASQTTNAEATQSSPEATTLPDSKSSETTNSNNNQNQNDTPITKESPDLNNSPITTTFKEVVMEDTDENPLSNTNKFSSKFSTPSSKSTANNNNNSSGISTPTLTLPTSTPPTPASPPISLQPPSKKLHSSKANLPPVPPSAQPSTPKNTTNSVSNPSVTTKAATAPKSKGLFKSKLKSKGKNKQDETD